MSVPDESESAVLYKLHCFVAAPAAFLEKLLVIQLVEKLSDIYGIQKFPRACCWSLSRAAQVQYISWYPTYNYLMFQSIKILQ